MLATATSNLVALPAAQCAAPSGTSGRRASRRQPAPAAAAAGSSSSSSSALPEECSSLLLPRRQLLSAAVLAPAAAVLLGGASPALAEVGAPALTSPFTYNDEADKFSITVPAGWVQGGGALGQEGTLTSQQARFSNAAGMRRVVAFVPEDNPSVSLAITIQFIAPDFTKLGSLGTAADFASGVVNRMDTSYIQRLPEWRRAKEGPVQIAQLLDAREANGNYVFSYSLAKEGEAERTVYQAVAIGFTGRYQRLFTVNATCTAPDKAKYGPVLDEMVKSFRAPPPPMV